LPAALGDTTLEALDASAAVHELLASCVERVAVRADLDAQLVLRSTGDELVAQVQCTRACTYVG